EVRIHRVQQPEIRDVGSGEVSQALVLLPPCTGELAAPGRHDLDQSAQQAHQIFVAAYLEQGRDESWIQAKRACIGSLQVGDAQYGAAFPILVLRQQPQVLARNLQGLVARTSVFVAEGRHFHHVAAAAIRTGGNVQSALPVIRHRQVNIQALVSRLELLSQRLRGRRRIRLGNLEHQSIGKNARRARNRKLTFTQQLLIQRELAETPGAELQRLQTEIQRV